MARILVVAYKDHDITEGLRKLMQMPQVHATEIIACDGLGEKMKASLEAVSEEFDIAYFSCATTALVLDNAQNGDHLAFVWDDSELVHKALAAKEDFGLDMWDITDGLSSLTVAPVEDDLEAEMMGAFMNLMDSMVDYITENVLAIIDATTDTGDKA